MMVNTLYILQLMNGTRYTFKTDAERWEAFCKLPVYRTRGARFYEMVQ